MKFTVRAVLINALAVFMAYFFIPIVSDLYVVKDLSFYPLALLMGLVGCILFLAINLFALMKVENQEIE